MPEQQFINPLFGAFNFIRVYRKDTHEIIGKIVNFSPTGVCVLFQHVIKLGDMLDFDIKLGEPDKDALVSRLQWRVCWVRDMHQNQQTFLCGLELSQRNYLSQREYQEVYTYLLETQA